MSYTYNRDIPAANNNPSSDQPLMQTNTNSIYDIINQDHVTFGNGTESGYHKVIHFKNQSANPSTDSSHGQLYTRTRDSFNQLFYEDTGGTVYQVTSFPQASNNGYTFLPSGILIQWGIVNGTHAPKNTFDNGDTGTVTFATSNIAFPNACFLVQTTMGYKIGTVGIPDEMGTVAIDTSTLSKTKFNWTYPQNTGVYTSFYWMAIGN